MKSNNALILVLAILLLTLISGCKKTPLEELAQSPESMKQEENLEYEDKTASQEAPLKYGDITDPVELGKLWQEYIFDSITTIGNTRKFNTPMEIDPVHVAEFCCLKYVMEHGQENLELASEDGNSRLFPLEKVLVYAKRYFNLISLDVTGIDDGYYDPGKSAFIFNFGSKRDRTAYTESNSWGIHLDKVTRNTDGTITVVLVHHDSPKKDRIELTQKYTLKQREDGSLYFVSGRWDYVNNHLVVLTGNYQRFDQIRGFAGNMEDLSMLGEADGRLIMAYTPYDEENKPALMLVNPDNMTVEKKLDIDEIIESTDVSLTEESIIIRLKDKFLAVDKTLSQMENIPLPETITKKINREAQYNDKGTPDVFFGGYDVSGDRKSYIYADETGVKLLNVVDNSERLLSQTVPITNSELIDNSYHMSPRFVDDERKVITTMTGYEGANGYTIYDLNSEMAKTYHITGEWSSTGFIRYDTGMLEINTYLYSEEKQESECKTVFLDFETGNIREIRLNDSGDTGDIRDPNRCYVGQNYAAFATYIWDTFDNPSSMFYLNRLNLRTLTVESKIISVKAAETYILGVLEDGRIIFWYSLNPSEEGICITK